MRDKTDSPSWGRRALLVGTALALVALPVDPQALSQRAWQAVTLNPTPDDSGLLSQAWGKRFGSFSRTTRSYSSSSRNSGSYGSNRSSGSFWQRPRAVTPPASGATSAPRAPNAASGSPSQPTVAVPQGGSRPNPSASTSSGRAMGSGPAVPNAASSTTNRPTFRTPSGGLNMSQAQASRTSGTASAPNRATLNSQQRAQARDRFYAAPNYQNPRLNRYRSSFGGRGFGSFAGGFLASYLLMSLFDSGSAHAQGSHQDMPQDRLSPDQAETWYALSGEPEVLTFLDDSRAEALAAGDTDVVARIDALKAEISAMEQQGLPRPPIAEALQQANIPLAVAYSDQVAVPAGPVALTMSTGSLGGVYNSLCEGDPQQGFEGLKMVGERYGLEVTCRNSGGGNDNLRLAALHEAQVFPVQADNLYYYKARTQQTFGDNEYVLYQEPFLMLTSKKSNIGGLSDISAKTTLYVVGGAELSWNILRDFAANDTFLGFGGNTDYARATVRRVASVDQALEAVSTDPNAVLFVVMAVQAKTIQSIESRFGDRLRLVPVDDTRFLSLEDSNGGRVYTRCDVPGDALPKLQEGALWGTNDTATLCTDALLVVQQDWVKTLSDDQARQVAMAVLEMLEHVGIIAPRMDF